MIIASSVVIVPKYENDILLMALCDENNKYFEKAICRMQRKEFCSKDLYNACKWLANPANRNILLAQIARGEYHISPSHEGQVPKDDGTMRTVYANTAIDRILQSAISEMLFDMFPQWVHKKCRSYLKGISTADTVQEVANVMKKNHNISAIIGASTCGTKTDMRKYFDTVARIVIRSIWDRMRKEKGNSVIIDMEEEYYNMDYYFDIDNILKEKYRSLQQGCAIAAFLADVVLYETDNIISSIDGVYYVRYSDDILIIGNKWEEGLGLLNDQLTKLGLELNPKKTQFLDPSKWFTFLGYSIKGGKISISPRRLRIFAQNVWNCTCGEIYAKAKNGGITYKEALNNFYKYFYVGDGIHSPASSLLRVMNETDVKTMDKYVRRCLRFVIHGKPVRKYNVGSLGFRKEMENPVYLTDVSHSKGNVPFYNNYGQNLNGYYTMSYMQNLLRTSSAAYEAQVKTMLL